MIQLTDQLIKDSFIKTGVDSKYYPQYETEAKRRYESLQKDEPDYEDTPENQSNAICSLDMTDNYIVIYVEEREKGHCHEWSNTYAYYSVLGEKEYWIARYALDSLKEDERDKELDIHAKSINEDPVFIEQYKCLFDEGECDARDMANDYCQAYHQCIAKGKSEVYSHAYADIVNEGYYEEFCEIHAEAYELAINHGMDKYEAYMFGDFCTDAADRNLFSKLNEFSKKYKEEWQRDFYFHLLSLDYEKNNKTRMSDSLIKDVKQKLYR